jgi:serine/threonine protein kinase
MSASQSPERVLRSTNASPSTSTSRSLPSLNNLHIGQSSPIPQTPTPARYDKLPALERNHRYVITGDLQPSLYGVVKLAFDRYYKMQVAIKISRLERANLQQTRAGVHVLENVRREAALMQYLHLRSASGNAYLNSRLQRDSIYGEMFDSNYPSSPPSEPSSSQSSPIPTPPHTQRHHILPSHLQPHQQQPSSNPFNNRRPLSDYSYTPPIRTSAQLSRLRGAVSGYSSRDESYSGTEKIESDEPIKKLEKEKTEDLANIRSPTMGMHLLNSPANSGTRKLPPFHKSSPDLAPKLSSSPFGTGIVYEPPFDELDLEGENYVCKYIEELEDEHFHYLITEYIPAGDLYSMLTSFPSHRLSERQARKLFRQMVLGVQYLHRRNVAHLDVSLENMCLDTKDRIRIIDFGVSAVHPFTPAHYHKKYLEYHPALSPISNFVPIRSPDQPAIRVRRFLCKAIRDVQLKPGKVRYMSPELFQGQSWDAFADDVYSLGVILYSLLTGRPPFQRSEVGDVWFQVIYTGQWLTPSIRNQPSAHIYTHLSDQALSLIDQIIKPQDARPTVDEILAHPWMTANDA